MPSWKLKPILTCVLGLLLFICTSGCAGERVTKEAVKTFADFSSTVATKIPITEGHITADGRVLNPKYRFMAGLFNGIIGEIQLEGVEVRGGAYGQGRDGDNTVDQDVAKIIKENRDRPDLAIDKIIDHLLSQKNTTDSTDTAGSGQNSGNAPPGAGGTPPDEVADKPRPDEVIE